MKELQERKFASKGEKGTRTLDGALRSPREGLRAVGPQERFREEMESLFRKWRRLAKKSADRLSPGSVHRLRRFCRRMEGVLLLDLHTARRDVGRRVLPLLKKTLRLSRSIRNRDVLLKIARAEGIPIRDLPNMRRRSGRFRKGIRRIRVRLEKAWSKNFEPYLDDVLWVEGLSESRNEKDRQIRLKAELIRLRLAIETWRADPERSFEPVHRIRLALKAIDAQWKMAGSLWPRQDSRGSAAGKLKRILVKLGRMSDLETLRRAFLENGALSARGACYFHSIPVRQERIARSLLPSEKASAQ